MQNCRKMNLITRIFGEVGRQLGCNHLGEDGDVSSQLGCKQLGSLFSYYLQGSASDGELYKIGVIVYECNPESRPCMVSVSRLDNSLKSWEVRFERVHDLFNSEGCIGHSLNIHGRSLTTQYLHLQDQIIDNVNPPPWVNKN